MNPLFFSIKGNSLDDGPGVRTAIFFKGCPLDCRWCHNPEGKRVGQELSFDAVRCIDCRSCLNVCPNREEDRSARHTDRCQMCRACVDACPSNALRICGDEIALDDLVSIIERDHVFFDRSGGGVTFTGGEPTLFIDFLSELAKAVKRRGIHALLETCGSFDWSRFSKQLLGVIDTVYFDIKLIDDTTHVTQCGVSNRRILDNLARLAQVAQIDLVPRIPLVPGITATEENLTGIARLLVDLGFGQVRLLPYNPLWPSKLNQLGVSRNVPMESDWMSAQWVTQLKQIFLRCGIETGGDL